MSKKDKRRCKLVYVVRCSLRDNYGSLECVQGVYEGPDEAWRVCQELDTDKIAASVTISLLWEKETTE